LHNHNPQCRFHYGEERFTPGMVEGTLIFVAIFVAYTERGVRVRICALPDQPAQVMDVVRHP